MFIPIADNKYELVVDKSRFISLLFKINNLDDVNKLLKKVKEEYPKARHYLYAYKLKDKSKSSDDKEPGNIAKGFIELINKKEIDNILIIVVRYFGGIKLGASRLLRTYLNGVSEVINTSKLGKLIEVYKYTLKIDYPTFNKLKNAGYLFENIQYFDKIKLDIISVNDISNELSKLKVNNYIVNRVERIIK